MPTQTKPRNEKTKAASPKAIAPTVENDDQQKNTFTLSVRLTEEQKQRLEIAARLRGWTPTTLLRIAAMEKVAYVINTTTPTNMDLRKMAEAFSKRFMEGRKQLTVQELKALKMAAHYGGSEFLNMVIDGCLSVLSRTRTDLPSPVDPAV
jgi:uncharacterized protein (DUF1778 family)